MQIPSIGERHAHRGVAHLRVAVLEVLYEAAMNSECLGAAEISRRAGIFREAGYATKQGNDTICWGVLNSLVKDYLITKCVQRIARTGREIYGWRLTDETFERRNREVTDVPDWGGDRRIIQAYRTKQWGFCPGCLAVLPERPDVDHIRARSQGGSDEAVNKQLLCLNCNRRRGAKPFEVFVDERLADGNEMTDYPPD